MWLGTDALLWALGVKPPAEVLSRALGELTLTARIQLYALGRLHRLQVVFGFFFYPVMQSVCLIKTQLHVLENAVNFVP